MVAMRRDLTKGARHIAPANIRWLYCQAVRRSGLWDSKILRKGFRKGTRRGGGRGVNGRLRAEESESGDSIIQGRPMEARKVIIEKITREREPTRPTSPRWSAEALVRASGW